jgi:hypothetical protein
MIYGPKDDGTYVVEFMTADGDVLRLAPGRSRSASDEDDSAHPQTRQRLPVGRSKDWPKFKNPGAPAVKAGRPRRSGDGEVAPGSLASTFVQKIDVSGPLLPKLNWRPSRASPRFLLILVERQSWSHPTAAPARS